MASSVGGQILITVEFKLLLLIYLTKKIPLCLTLFFYFIYLLFFPFGCSVCHHVFCFQGIKAHGSATLSSRRQLRECLCSAII